MNLGGYLLTTNHAASSYGQPVLVYEGVAHGYGDLTRAQITAIRDAAISKLEADEDYEAVMAFLRMEP